MNDTSSPHTLKTYLTAFAFVALGYLLYRSDDDRAPAGRASR